MYEDIRRAYGAGVERVTVSLAPDQLTMLDDLGREWGLNRSEMTRLAIIKLLRDPILFLPSLLDKTTQVAREERAPAISEGEKVA